MGKRRRGSRPNTAYSHTKQIIMSKQLQRGTQRTIAQKTGVSESTISRRVRNGDAATVVEGKRIEGENARRNALQEKGLQP